MHNNDDKDINKYNVYLEQRTQLIDGELRMSLSFDKYVLTLSSGAFALSITFLVHVARVSGGLTSLFLAWIFLGSSILMTLVSLITSQHAYRSMRDRLDLWFKEDKEDKEDTVSVECMWSRCTAALNWLSMVAFIGGLVSMLWFAVQKI